MVSEESPYISKIIHVLLTGGVGSRLWPLSRKSKPKQYIKLFKEKSLFQLTYERNSALVESLTVVGNVKNNHLSKAVLKEAGQEYFDIVEATPRNTAPAIAMAAFHANPSDVLLVTPSDHMIKGGKLYRKAIQEGIEKANEGVIVTFGVKPTRPETGYGYIEYKGNDVVAFREKPNEDTAKYFIARGDFLWNSGMFCFQAGVFLEELEKYAPKVYATAKNAFENSMKNEGTMELDFDLSMNIPAISFDFAVLERSERIKVIPTDFKWSDLGSFESIYDYLKSTGYPIDDKGNMVLGTNKHTEFVGVKNTIVVSTPDANLILRKSKSQEVKDVYSRLESEGSSLLD